MTATGRGRIALINDDTTFLELMHDLLESIEGYEVLICKESQNAYGLVKENQPDLVLLDIRMGGEERGWTILELLTLDPTTRPIPIIVCSAAIRDLQAHSELLDQLGIDVLPKPFDLDLLLDKVRMGLARSGVG
jgi:DNA-binding response OmpR family regulator